MPRRFQFLVLALTCTAVTSVATAAPPLQFNRDVRPILSDKCFTCHGPDAAARQGDLRLDDPKEAVADRGGHRAITPGNLDASEIWQRIISKEDGERMPPVDSELTLSPPERDVLRRWIVEGAKYEPHWSFIPPLRPKVPQSKAATGLANPIDAFILAKLDEEKLAPAPEADPVTLCRRLYLDLTGIPPTPAEVDDFVSAYSLSPPLPLSSSSTKDRETGREGEREKAYEALVDKLLASPRYGERMAAPWLDAARYADTNGYQTDGPRRMWRWRDWVIDAYNRNLPYDRFTIEQLAGDLLPKPTLDQLIATGFNRNHRMNAEGGIIAEEYLVEYVADRVETTTAVWLGLTMGCARCHDHKYDPLSQREFYQLFAFFNLVPEPGKAIRDDNSPPYIPAPSPTQQAQLDKLNADVRRAEKHWASLSESIGAAEKKWAADALRLYSQWTFDDNLIARFRFDGALGDDVDPVSPAKTENDRPPQFAPGPFGESLSVGRGGGRVTTAKHPEFDSEAPYSASVWLRPTDDETSTVYASMDDDMSMLGLELRLVERLPQVVIAARIVDDYIRVEAEEPLVVNEWSHITWTYDGSRAAAGVRIFIDGRPTNVKIINDTLSNKTKTTEPVVIGGGGTGRDFRGRVADLRFYARELAADEAAIVYCDLSIRALAQDYGNWRDPACALKLREYFLRFAASEEIKTARRAVVDAKAAVREFEKTIPTTMVMRDVPGLRATHILKRGEYDKPGEAVTAGVPQAFQLPLPSDAATDRLALARWLVDRRNPLTARVAVNRLWQQFFGVGLVKTVEDFGAQGEWPEHRELLDWLAVEFMEGAGRQALGARNANSDLAPSAKRQAPTPWDTKRLIKLIVTSAAYRQSSHVSPAAAARDPENRLAARGPRFRLSAEAIRDSALAVSGLLHERLGGPSVKPYQPEGLWEELANNAAGGNYVQDHGPDLYRRSLYTFRKRTVAQPMMANFDAAARETCVVRQSRTNTPLQALDLMNDVTFVEAARGLAAQAMQSGGNSPTSRIEYAFRRALCRRPTSTELQVLQRGFARRLAEFRANPDAAKKLIAQGESTVGQELDFAELAAYTTVGNVILNLDEFVTRE